MNFFWQLLLAFVLIVVQIKAREEDNTTTVFINDIFTKFKRKTGISHTDFDQLLLSLKIGGHYEFDHDHNEEGHEHHNIEHAKDHATCYSSERLLDHFGYHNNVWITSELFENICPAIIQQQLFCVKKKKYQTESFSGEVEKTPTEAERYGYGTLAVAIVSYLPLIILIAIPKKASHRHFPYIMNFLIALGTSILASDALLHLLPSAIGIGHDHVGHADEHEHDDYDKQITAEFSDASLKACIALAAIYIMYLLEMLIGTRAKTAEPSSWSGGHGHSHGPAAVGPEPKTDDLQCNSSTSDIETTDSLPQRGGWKQLVRECIPSKSYGWMMIFGDCIHNFIDGIAIGGTFSVSVVQGVSTSLAILFHEIPHEIGDFAALLRAGMSWRGAMVWNFIQTITAFIGLYIGLGVATNPTAQTWVFAFTTGIFLHISLCGLMPELHDMITSRFWLFFSIQNLGILLGFTIMFLIAIYEDVLHNLF